MTFEADLQTLLKTVTPRVYPDFAPVSTQRPYVTYQQIGGNVLNMVANVAPGVRNSHMQISVWSNTRAEALTNANPALATSASHGYVDNDEVLVLSGWEDATNQVLRVDQQDVNTFTLLGLDTTNTRFFPTGSGIGTAQKIGTWVQIPQVLN